MGGGLVSSQRLRRCARGPGPSLPAAGRDDHGHSHPKVPFMPPALWPPGPHGVDSSGGCTVPHALPEEGFPPGRPPGTLLGLPTDVGLGWKAWRSGQGRARGQLPCLGSRSQGHAPPTPTPEGSVPPASPWPQMARVQTACPRVRVLRRPAEAGPVLGGAGTSTDEGIRRACRPRGRTPLSGPHDPSVSHGGRAKVLPVERVIDLDTNQPVPTCVRKGCPYGAPSEPAPGSGRGCKSHVGAAWPPEQGTWVLPEPRDGAPPPEHAVRPQRRHHHLTRTRTRRWGQLFITHRHTPRPFPCRSDTQRSTEASGSHVLSGTLHGSHCAGKGEIRRAPGAQATCWGATSGRAPPR